MPGETHRLWYVGAGCSVMVASMYLVRKINDARPTATVRLYEGFVSYKTRSIKSDHGLDTRLLREVVKNHQDFRQCIVPADKLKTRPDDVLSSAFRVIGLDCGVPVVIRPEVPPDHAIGS